MKGILENISQTAELFARSQGWRPFDTMIELDLYIPWAFKDAIHAAFFNQASIIVPTDKVREMLQDAENPIQFKQLRLPQNILINLINDQNRYGFVMSKKESPDPTQLRIAYPDTPAERDGGAKIVEMFPEVGTAA